MVETPTLLWGDKTVKDAVPVKSDPEGFRDGPPNVPTSQTRSPRSTIVRLGGDKGLFRSVSRWGAKLPVAAVPGALGAAPCGGCLGVFPRPTGGGLCFGGSLLGRAGISTFAKQLPLASAEFGRGGGSGRRNYSCWILFFDLDLACWLCFLSLLETSSLGISGGGLLEDPSPAASVQMSNKQWNPYRPIFLLQLLMPRNLELGALE